MHLKAIKLFKYAKTFFPRDKVALFFATYPIALLVIYGSPLGLGDEWYNIYEYLDKHGAIPYLDEREGYPPIGFLVYMPLYHLCKGNPPAFYYCFRFVNGLAIVMVVTILYAIFKSTADRSKALKYTVAYSILPSVILANTYSNDVIALLPATLAIYAMIKKKPKLCGILLGLATLSKGFPALLIVPALIKFQSLKEKFEVIGLFSLTFLYVSLPFLALNPLAYISTFIHHGSRGPWETIWALIDGYNSHGGFLHPYFDKYFYHGNLVNVYTFNHYDHAFYLWKYDQLPGILTLSQILFIAIFSLAYANHPNEATELCGFLYLTYMLFFKGYSTQFAVSTSLYLILATQQLKLLAILELSHMMQILSWNYATQINIRNIHAHLLASSILIRTFIFAYVLILPIKNHFSDLKHATAIVVRFLEVIKWALNNKRIIISAILVVLTGFLSLAQICNYLHQKDNFRILIGDINLSQNKWANITLSNLERGDKILIKLSTHTWVETYVTPKVVIERGVRNPCNFKGSFNETMLFFRAEAKRYILSLRIAHPKIPFRVTDGFKGDLEVNIESNNSALIIKLVDKGVDGKDSRFRIAYPYETYVDDDFKINMECEVIAASKPVMLLDVFDETDEWLYAFKITKENFTLTSETPSIDGYANLRGDLISLVALSVTIKEGTSATIILKNLSINNQTIKFYTESSELLSYKIYIEKSFRAPEIYYITLFLFNLLITYAILLLIQNAKNIITCSSLKKT